MKTTIKDSTVGEVVRLAGTVNPNSKKPIKATFTGLMNKLVWYLSWHASARVWDIPTARDILAVFHFARITASTSDNPSELVRVNVLEGISSGLYLYEPTLGLLTTYVAQDDAFCVYFCHPEGDILEPPHPKHGEPYEFLPIELE